MFVTALVELEPTAALRVPASAVFLFGDRRYVLSRKRPAAIASRPSMLAPNAKA